MTNYEKHKNEIEKFARLNLNFALTKDTKEIVKCEGFNCKNCVFFCSIRGCSDNKIDWADEQYTESEIDWSKVPVDTKIYVRDSEYEQLLPRYFAKYENNKVYAWCTGATSFSAKDNATKWKYAKLAEEE